MTDIRSALVNNHSSRAQVTAVAAVFALALLGASAFSVDDAAAAWKPPAGAVKLQGKLLQKSVGKVRCGKINGSWVPGTKLAGPYFISHTQQATNFKKLASRTKGKARTKNLKTAASFKSKASSQLKSCRVTTPTPTPAPSNQLRFSLAGAAGLALKATAGASSHARNPGARAAATGSNLQTVTSTGTVADAVTSGTANVSKFLIAPNGKVYVVFAQPVDLTTGQPSYNTGVSCLLAEVAPASGVPTCIDSTMQSISWPSTYSRIKNPPIQFDSSGAIYYSGRSATGNTILRKYSNGQATDLISDDVDVYGFIAVPEGGAIITGRTTATGASWTRRVTAEGSLRSLINESAYFLSSFADGNIYISSWYSNALSSAGVRRYLTASNQLDTREWISASGDDPGPTPYFWGYGFCTDPVLQAARLGFCGLRGVAATGFFNTTDGKTFALAGNAPNTTLAQYYPTIVFPATNVKNISVAQGVITNLILAGTNASGQNIMTLFNTSNDVETPLLGADNEIEIYHVNYVAGENKVLFDGLRFSDNKYVLGQVDLSTKQVSVTSTIAAKWSDFQTFG